jgi:WD40 repeat protein
MKYRAFLSYSRSDDAIASWLHSQLDGYRPPGDLAGTNGHHGPVPRRLHPIFRDRTDLEAGGQVSGALQAALEDSESLIVLCSPASARSTWVDLECEAFMRMGREGRILPVIASGEPDSGDPETECFPPALRGKGLLAADLREIRMPNGRLIGDGRDAGRMKLIAGLLGVPLDGLVQREKRRQRLRLVTAAVAAAIFAVVAVIAIVQTVEQLRQRARAEAERDRAEFSVARFVTERALTAMGAGNPEAAARYALLAGQDVPARNALAAQVLGRLRHETPLPLAGLAPQGSIVLTAWDEDGPRIARFRDRQIEIMNPDTGKTLGTDTLADGEAVCAASGAAILVCGPSGLVRAVSSRDASLRAAFTDDVQPAVTPVISLDGGRALSLGGGAARVWDTATGGIVDTRAFATDGMGDAFTLALSVEGRTALALRASGAALIWTPDDPAGAKLLPEMPLAGAACAMATPAPWTGRYDLVCSAEEGYEDIGVTLTAGGFESVSDPVTYGLHGSGPGNLMGKPMELLSGPAFVAPSSGTARFIEAFVTAGETREDSAVLEGGTASLTLAPGPRATLTALGGRVIAIPFAPVTADVSPDGEAVLLTGAEGEARLYALSGAGPQPLAAGRFEDSERSTPRGPVVSPDGRYAAAMRNVDSELLVLDSHARRAVTLFAFDRDDDLSSSQRRARTISKVLFEGDLISASTRSSGVLVWDLAAQGVRTEIARGRDTDLEDRIAKNGIEILPVEDRPTASPDGAFSVDLGADGAAILRVADSGLAVAAFGAAGDAPLRAIAFSPDSRALATLSTDGALALWDLSVFRQGFDEAAAWACTRLLVTGASRHFSEAEIAADPLLRERGVTPERTLCPG